MSRLLTALFLIAAATAAPAAQSLFETDPAYRARELKILRDGEAKFLQTLPEFDRLLSENPGPGTPARTRLQQLAVQLDNSAAELRGRFDFAWRYPGNREELSTLTRPWERFLKEQSPAVRELIREGRAVGRPIAPLPGGPASSPSSADQDFDINKLSRDIGVPLGPPVSQGSPGALSVPPSPQARTAPDSRPYAYPQAQPPITQAPPPPSGASPNAYFAVLTPAYRTFDDEWKVPECRYRVVQRTRTNYGSRREAEGDADRLRSSGYADAEARYFDTWQAMDAFMRDWAQRRTSDSRQCDDAYARAKGRAPTFRP